ncbi:MAG: histidinol-phosphate aminotransferase [Actinomycetota bacterium]|jgi:histidinol-phosphate aminotransferase
MARPLIPVRDDLQLFSGYHSPQVAVDVRLNTNESPYPPPRGWLDALQQEIAAIPFNRYPDRQAVALRTALAELHGVRPDQVFAANGSNEVLLLLLLAYGGPGRTAAVFEPTYALHSHIARVTGTSVVEGARRDDFTLDLDEVRRVLTLGPEVTFLCSPNNPTGRVERRGDVVAVAQAAPGLVVVDEAYGQFASWSALDLVSDDESVVVARTYSKTWSMAAARLGYLVGPAPLVAELDKVALPYHLDAVKQAAGRLALRYRPEMEARVAALVEERGRLTAAFAELPLETWPSESNFILFRPTTVPGHVVWERLLERSVLVRDCSSWPNLDGCLRVTVGTPDENGAFLAALKEALSA